MADVLIAAMDLPSGFKKGYIVQVHESPHEWGLKEALPNFIRLHIDDATDAQIRQYLEGWHIKFEHEILVENANGYRIAIRVDPIYISASDVGRTELKSRMQDFLTSISGVIRSISISEMIFDIAKPVNLVELKLMFADHFDTVLDIRRYYFNPADVDTAVGLGGDLTLSRAQVLSRINDKLDE